MSEIFQTYRKTTTRDIHVARITEENIGEIARRARATVDYAGGMPVIRQGTNLYKVGEEVSIPAEGNQIRSVDDLDDGWELVEPVKKTVKKTSKKRAD